MLDYYLRNKITNTIFRLVLNTKDEFRIVENNKYGDIIKVHKEYKKKSNALKFFEIIGQKSVMEKIDIKDLPF